MPENGGCRKINGVRLASFRGSGVKNLLLCRICPREYGPILTSALQTLPSECEAASNAGGLDRSALARAMTCF
jgi:hypothetical protein